MVENMLKKLIGSLSTTEMRMLPLAGEDFVSRMKFGDCQTGEVVGYEAFGPGMSCCCSSIFTPGGLLR